MNSIVMAMPFLAQVVRLLKFYDKNACKIHQKSSRRAWLQMQNHPVNTAVAEVEELLTRLAMSNWTAEPSID